MFNWSLHRTNWRYSRPYQKETRYVPLIDTREVSTVTLRGLFEVLCTPVGSIIVVLCRVTELLLTTTTNLQWSDGSLREFDIMISYYNKI